MKKLKYFLFCMCLCLMFIDYVDAAELKLVTNTDSVVAGDEVSAKLEFNLANETLNIDYCRVSISHDNGADFKETQALNSWTFTNKNVNNNVLDLNIKNYLNRLSNTENIAELKYTINKNTTLSITSLVCYDKDGIQLTGVNYNKNSVGIRAVVPSATELKSLMINGEELNPNFSPNVKSYNVNNFTDEFLSLEFELVDLSYQNKVQVLVNDKVVTNLTNIPYELSSDNKAMLITINIGDNSSYNVFVSKKVDSSFGNYLQSITINGSALELEPGKYDYTYTVSDDVKNVEVLSEIYDSSQFEFSSSSNVPGNFEMPGKVVAILNVVPKDSQSGIPGVTYTVTINNESYVEGVKNPDTADTSMYIILGILIVSLIGSTVLYQKNINGYK